jgi:hypothetical protein
MTGDIIRLHGEEHHEIQLLLPWYVTGRLEPQEQARVEAHLRTCVECLADLKFERQLDAEIAELPIEAESGWAQLQQKLQPPAPRPAPARRWQGWAIAAQFVLIAAMAVALVLPHLQPALYRTLGAPPPPAAGNILVIFRPDIRERDLRQALRDGGARLVDGPTAADAYMLQTPSTRRAAALAGLRARRDILLAEPVDAGATP